MSSYWRDAQHHVGEHAMGRVGAYSTTLFGWARTHMSSYQRVAQHHAGEHVMGRGWGLLYNTFRMGEDVYVLTFEKNL